MQKDVMIYRQAAIDAFEKELCDVREFAVGFVGAKRILESVPSAQPERKKGKWIDMGDFEQCSACTGTHLKEVNTVYGKATWIKSAFCPNCGADMRGEEDGK